MSWKFLDICATLKSNYPIYTHKSYLSISQNFSAFTGLFAIGKIAKRNRKEALIAIR